MKERKVDLFETIFEDDVDAICITTNGHYTRGGLAVMGGGCAKIAADRWPEVSKRLGTLLKQTGSNIPFVIGMVDENGEHITPTADLIKNKQFKCLIFSFPTINQLMDGANLQLIKQSSSIMVDYANKYSLKSIIIGRPGVGIGGLQWVDVKPELEKILDDRFTIVSFDHEEL
jgi:hypothetical protein